MRALDLRNHDHEFYFIDDDCMGVHILKYTILRNYRAPSLHDRILIIMPKIYNLRGLFVWIWLGLAVHCQATSCPLITINDLGSTTDFSTDGLIARAIVPPAEAVQSIPVIIRNFTIVCDASGDRINTSSFVSVVVELQCDSQSSNPSLVECDGSTVDTRQYQFQCIEQNGQPVWDTIVSGSNQFVQTLNPTATLSTPLANQCRRCIDDQQSSRAGLDPITHCDRESSIDCILLNFFIIIIMNNVLMNSMYYYDITM